jgi:pimeloyl-ACP methyl ester carboxylesterase
MRRVTTLALVAGGTMAVVAGGAFARTRLTGRGSAIPKPVTGLFPNGMAYVRWGTGPKTLLVIPGGPGNDTPSGMFLSRHLRVAHPLVEDGYTAWVVTRKRNMPKGYSIADMADDYGWLIADEFDGKVDAALGLSTGGMIAFYLAARHPARLGRIAIAVAGYVANGPGSAGDLTYARLLSEGRTADAIASMFDSVFTSWPRGSGRVLGALMAPFVYRDAHPSFRSDTLVEAEAEVTCNAREILPDISIPVLLVGAAEDQFFTRAVVEETARLIPDCTFRLYEGKDHLAGVSDERLPQDVFDFFARRDVNQPVLLDQPAVSDRPVSPTPSVVGSGGR